jgi:3-oxoacyl-[acyl-carrier protein] reductase
MSPDPIQMRLDGKVAVVTGAGGGIGAAIAVGLGSLGADTVVHFYRNSAGAARTLATIEGAGGSAVLAQADLTTRDGVAELFDIAHARGGIDILVNNAGDLVQRSSVEEFSDELYDYTLDLNLRSAFACCRAVLPTMRMHGSGSIINVSSVAARNGGGPGSVVYAAAKGALSTFTRGLAKEVANLGIRVNAISPGVIATAFHERNSSDAQLAGMLAGVPMGRAGRPEECVGAALFLASDEMSSFVTGQVIEINGGQYMP